MDRSFALRGDVCHCQDPNTLEVVKNGYLVCENGVSGGIFPTLPDRYSGLPVVDCGDKLIVPGLCDLHMHAPQYSFRALGMDLELLDWLDTRTFPEEAKYADTVYARKAYERLIADILSGPNTRLSAFSTLHVPATVMLMEMLEASGMVSMVGKVSMDRNSSATLCEASAERAAASVEDWLDQIEGRFVNTTPIITPRFVPSCSDDLMQRLGVIRRDRGLPVQSHLSENQGEVVWVKELCPDCSSYSDVYREFDMFGGDAPTIMAHCVWVDEEETELMRERGVFVAHCPQSNTNLSSGIAPARRFLDRGLRMGLGSDMAGGCHLSIFRAMADAVQASKLRWRLVEQADKPLTVEEAFWLATAGGGSFFGKVGKFDAGYELDALVIDDASIGAPFELTIPERLHRVVYLSDDRNIVKKFVRGKQVK